MPSEGNYALSTLGFRSSADWAGRLGLKSTSAFPTRHGKTLAISYGWVQATPADRQFLFSSFLTALASEVYM